MNIIFLFLSAIDLQNCGIGNDGGQRILTLLEYNKSLHIVDLRNNCSMNNDVLLKVMEILSTNNLPILEGNIQVSHCGKFLMMDNLTLLCELLTYFEFCLPVTDHIKFYECFCFVFFTVILPTLYQFALHNSAKYPLFRILQKPLMKSWKTESCSFLFYF